MKISNLIPSPSLSLRVISFLIGFLFALTKGTKDDKESQPRRSPRISIRSKTPARAKPRACVCPLNVAFKERHRRTWNSISWKNFRSKRMKPQKNWPKNVQKNLKNLKKRQVKRPSKSNQIFGQTFFDSMFWWKIGFHGLFTYWILDVSATLFTHVCACQGSFNELSSELWMGRTHTRPGRLFFVLAP